MNDKLLHAICGLCICTAVGLGLSHLGFTADFAKGSALLMSFAAGALKECYDLYKAWRSGAVINWKTLPKILDFFDFGATCCGGFAAIFILITVFKL